MDIVLVVKVIPAAKLIKFDEYIRCMCSHIGDHGKDLFPHISWCNGFSKLTNLSAADRVGKMFTCLLFLLTHQGSGVFTSFGIKTSSLYMTDSQKQKKRRNKVYSKNTKILDKRTNLHFNFIEVFEMTLCLLSWLFSRG